VLTINFDGDIRAEQRQDGELSAILELKENGTLPKNQRTANRIKVMAESMVVEDGILYHLWQPSDPGRRPDMRQQIVVPASLRQRILAAYHDEPLGGGHLGFQKTLEKIRETFYWPLMYSDVKHYVSSCKICNSKKGPKQPPTGLMQPIEVGERFEQLGVDFVGPLPETRNGNKWILVFSDYVSKWPEAFAVKEATATEVARHLVEDIVCRHGAPRRLLSDRGKAFLAQVIKETNKVLRIHKVNTSAYHPQTDGLVEKLNGTLETMLSMYVAEDQKDWDEYLPYILFAYRSTPHESTKETPFFLTYGRDPRLPINVSLGSTQPTPRNGTTYRAQLMQKFESAFELVRKNLAKAHERQKTNYDKGRREIEFPVGSRVWLYTPTKKKGLSPKLTRPWKGPFRVTQRVGKLLYKLRDEDGRTLKQLVHVQRLKTFTDRDVDDLNEEIELDEDDNFDFKLEQTSEHVTRKKEKIEEAEKTEHDSENENEKSTTRTPPNNHLSTLLKSLQDIHNTMKQETFNNIREQKRLLYTLLGAGSLYISNGKRQAKFKREISQTRNREELCELIESYLNNFETIFQHEIEKSRNKDRRLQEKSQSRRGGL
jgi:hypothetical protein